MSYAASNWSPTVLAFGKVPAAGDFLRWSSHVEPTPAFEAWVYEGMAEADARLGAAWSSAYAKGRPHAFVYRGPGATSDRLVAGVMRPSRDAVGRKFPIVIGTAFPVGAFGGRAQLLPLALGDFLDSAMHFAASCDGLRTPSELGEWLNHLRPPELHSASAYDAEYEGWQRSTPLETAWNAIFGPGNTGRAMRALYVLHESLATVRGHEAPNAPIGIRFPLGTAGIAAAAFWLDLVQAGARWRATVPTCFWSWDGSEGSLLLFVGEPNVRTFRELWAPDEDSDFVSDLVAPPTQADPARWLARLPAPLAACVQDPSSTVERLVAALRA